MASASRPPALKVRRMAVRTMTMLGANGSGHDPFWIYPSRGAVPTIYGPSGDMTWNEADPTYSLEAAKRAGK
jgi:hypothetical protein